MARAGASPDRSRAFEYAGPVGVGVPGRAGTPGMPKTRASTLS